MVSCSYSIEAAAFGDGTGEELAVGRERVGDELGVLATCTSEDAGSRAATVATLPTRKASPSASATTICPLTA